eukprot:TRINITY_DN24919_c0_g1_i1.p1 TRINITY_DN24919_c0_g1~~TRINITY_DN24919_c0_g1_i1.p1  ORF type:complete len:289 (+),score=32.51 TRINITY_DN24919_c0_g1_i1:181-1047(+)
MRVSRSLDVLGRLFSHSTRRFGTDASAARSLRQRGFFTPLPLVSQAAAADMLRKLREYELTCDGGLAGNSRFKTHLLLPWVADLIRAPAVVDALEPVLGPNILVWSSGWAVKQPGSRNFYSWHQDSTYAGVEPADDVAVAWIALTESTPSNGCVRYIPGSHLVQLDHEDMFEEDNLLSRGQRVPPDAIDEGAAVDAVLEPGQFALHHFRCVHGSGPNNTSSPRVGLQVVYMATHCKKTSGNREGAMLIRGADEHQHWELEPVLAHKHSMNLENENYFADSEGRKNYHK